MKKYKHLLVAMFWFQWWSTMMYFTYLIINRLEFKNIWVLVISGNILLVGLSIVEAIEDKKPVVINLNGETTVNEVKE